MDKDVHNPANLYALLAQMKGFFDDDNDAMYL